MAEFLCSRSVKQKRNANKGLTIVFVGGGDKLSHATQKERERESERVESRFYVLQNYKKKC